MAAIIEVMGKVVSFDGKNWMSEEPDVAELCRLRAENLPYAYYPDPVSGLATDVAKSLRGRVISLDPPEPESDDEDPDILY
jgi:hypothetical protein